MSKAAGARVVAAVVRGLVTLAGLALAGWAVAADARWPERHLLAGACATSAAGWTAARVFRWIAAAGGLLAAWKLAPALGARAPRALTRVRAGAAVAVALAVLAALGAGEVAARTLRHRLLPEGAPGDAERERSMARPDPRLGWAYVPGRTTRARVGGRLVEYAIDADGDRAASSAHRGDPSRPTVLFTGESIAFGYGLAWEETVPYLVSRDLGVQAVDLAVVGYGNDQAYLRAVDALPRFARPLAVVTVFVPQQLARDVEPWRPRLGLDGHGALVPLAAEGGAHVKRLLRELPFHGGERLRVAAAILRATARAARERGAFPLFVVTNYGPPCVRDDGGEAWVVNELFARQGLDYVRVDLGGEDLLPGLLERHPGPRGAAKLARAVAGVLGERLGRRASGGGAPGP